MSGSRNKAGSAALAFLLAACAPTQGAAAGNARMMFDCGGGPEVQVVFHGDSAEVIAPNQPVLMMQRRAGQRVFAFDGGIRSATLDGDVLTLVTGRMAPITCHASDKPIAATRGAGPIHMRRLS